MNKLYNKIVVSFLLIILLFSHFSPLMAVAQVIDSNEEMNSELIGDEKFEEVSGEESQKLYKDEEYYEVRQKIIEKLETKDYEVISDNSLSQITKEDYDIYILEDEFQYSNELNNSLDYFGLQIRIHKIIILESLELVQFSVDDEIVGWIDSEAIESSKQDVELVEEDSEVINKEEVKESPEALVDTELIEDGLSDNNDINEENEDIINGDKEEDKEDENDTSTEIRTMSSRTVATQPTIQYRSHVEKQGWLPWVGDRVISGTLGQRLQMEAFQLKVDNANLGLRYQTRSERGDWTGWVNSDNIGGTTGERRQLEGLRIELTGQDSTKYDVYYRVHTESFGWLPWAKNGEKSGSEGFSYRVESMQVSILPKGNNSISTAGESYRYKPTPKITYRSHVQSKGWMSWVSDRSISGTSGQGLRMEAFQLNVSEGNLGVRYQTRSLNGNWSDWRANGQTGGTTNQQKQLEGIRIELTGQDSSEYDVYYRVHTEKFGWLPWAKNGDQAGTEGYNYRIESMQVTVLPKSDTTITTGKSYNVVEVPSIRYQTHVERIGWQSWVDGGQPAGTSGRGLRLEAIRLELNQSSLSGGIEYRTHIQSDGWASHSNNGSTSGTVGSRKRLEAIEIRLTGEVANQYDVYYRTHVQSEGWLGWVKNGMPSGSEGLAYRLEAIEVKLVPQGQGSPVDADAGFLRKPLIYLDAGHGGNESGAVSGGVLEKTLNLQTSKRIETLLKNMGYRVHMSRTDDSQLTLSHRAQEANRMNADIFVSVHYNAFRGTAQGIETYYYNQNGNTSNPYANSASRISNSRSLANSIHHNVLLRSGAVDRNVRTANFHVIRETHMPAVLLELGYMDHAGERAKITTASYQQRLAQGVADGINQYFRR